MDAFAENSFNTKKLEKGTIILSKGSICKYAYRVNKGCLISYAIDKAGKEHIIQFAPEDWVIGDMDSFFNSKPSNIYIKAIEESEVMVLDKKTFDNIDNSKKEFVSERNTKLVRNLISMNRRLINLLSATGEERYLDFIETYPALIQRLPLKLIASYIGVTPEYLSEIRKKIAHK